MLFQLRDEIGYVDVGYNKFGNLLYMATSIQLRRGLFRLWVVSTLIWIVGSAVVCDAPAKILYAWQYATDRELADAVATMEACKKHERTKYHKEQTLPHDEVIEQMVSEEKCRERLQTKVARPDWSWLVPVVAPPTLGVLLTIAALWVFLRVVQWVWRGFRPQ